MPQPPEARKPPRDGEERGADPNRPKSKIDANDFAGAGLAMGLSIALFALGGNWLDGKLGTAPLFVLLGVFVGFAGGFYSLYARLVLAPRRERDEGPGGE